MKALSYIFLFSLVIVLAGCETVKGAVSDVANTARNIRDIFTAGKTIGDVVK